MALHNSLLKKINWYDSWHKHPRHQHAHWFGLFLFLLVTSLLVSVQTVNFYFENDNYARAQTATLPNSNHPMMLSYYYSVGQYGDFIDETSPYTNTEIITSESWIRGTNGACLRDTAGLNSALQHAVSVGHNIIFYPGIPNAPIECPDGQNEFTVAMNIARNYWNNIDILYVADEPTWNRTETENNITNLENAIAQLGLSSKDIMINYTQTGLSGIVGNDGWQASNLDIVSFEAYYNPAQQNEPNIAATVQNEVNQTKAVIGSRRMMIVIQGYNRNGTWTNLNSLQSIQVPAYLASYNDPNVIGLTIFSYARPGGSRDLGDCLKNEHRKIWGAITGGAQPASATCGGTGTPTPTPGPTGLQLAPLLTNWSPPQTNNGWFPYVSPDGRYVSYGFWPEGWLTDLQTDQYWDLRENLPDTPLGGARQCTAASLIQPDTFSWKCALPVGIDAGGYRFGRYEMLIDEWTPQLTGDDPYLVAGQGEIADGHWSSLVVDKGLLVKDNQVLATGNLGGGVQLSGDTLIHACDNTNAEICVWDEFNQAENYTVQVPNISHDIKDEYIVYGGSDGHVRGICRSDGQDINLGATSWNGEGENRIVMVNDQPWVMTTSTGNPNGSTPDRIVLLRPWGQRDSIVINAGTTAFSGNGRTAYSVAHHNGIFTIALFGDRGELNVITVADTAPRNNLSGGLAPESCGPILSGPTPIPTPMACPVGTPLDTTTLCDFSPAIARRGDNIKISGRRLTSSIGLYNSSGEITNVTGTLSNDNSTLDFIVPTNIELGSYSVGVITGTGVSTLDKTLQIVLELPTTTVGTQAFDDINALAIPPADDFGELINNIVTYSYIVVGVAMFIMIMWGGFLWMTSAANPGNISTAKRYIFNAVIGAVLLLSSYVILYTVNPELVGGRLSFEAIPSGTSSGAQSFIIQPTCDNGVCSNNSGEQCIQDIDCNAICINNTCNNGSIGACALDVDCTNFARYIATSEAEAAEAFSVGCSGFDDLGFQDIKSIECPDATDTLAQDFIVQVQEADANDQIDVTAVQSSGNQGAGRRIVLLDTGYNRTHPELTSSYIGGYDFINNDGDPMDDQATGTGSPGHGSHVAGIITGDGINGQAVGVAPQAQIIAGKILNSSGSGYFSGIINGIYWAINGPDEIFGTADDFRPDAINISVGGGLYTNLCDTADATAREIYKAIQYARDHGALVVIAAGNNPGGIAMPGCVSNSLTVGAVNDSDAVTSFSGRGAGLDVVAPGLNIYSSLLGNNYGNKSGTSMAAPMVSGLIALIKNAFPNYTVDQVEQSIINTAVDLGSPGKDITYGWGRITADSLGVSSGCAGNCGTITASPASCTKGVTASNPNCDVTISYTSSGSAPADLVLRKNGAFWRSTTTASGTRVDTNPTSGAYTYSLNNRNTGAVIASTTVYIYYNGTLDSTWLSCTKNVDPANPNCNITLNYSVSGSTTGSAAIYKDGRNWRTVSLPAGSSTDSNPTAGTHTYTLRDSTGRTQIERVVIRIEAGTNRLRVINSLSVPSAQAGTTITINGRNLGNALEVARGYFTVQLHDKNRNRYSTIANLNPGNTSGTWTVLDYPPGDYTLRVGPTLNANDVSQEVSFTILP